MTGSFLPERFKDSDADFNVGMAVAAVQCLEQSGVFVAMNGLVIPVERAFRLQNGTFARS